MGYMMVTRVQFGIVVTLLAAIALLCACHPPRSPALRSANVQIDRPIDELVVSVSTNDWLAWRIDFANNADEAIQIIWDESSFVDGAGHSWGRLIPGRTRRMDIAAPHPPLTLAGHATISGLAIPDRVAAGGVDPYAMTPAQMNGSRLILTVQTPAGKQTWQATLTTG